MIPQIPGRSPDFAVAQLLGGMVFFAAVVAPLVFTRLPPEHAVRFIRQLFPVYYLYVLATSAVGAIALAWSLGLLEPRHRNIIRANQDRRDRQGFRGEDWAPRGWTRNDHSIRDN